MDVENQPCIPARWELVTGTNRRTTIGNSAHHVALVEHVLAALSGMRIDNCEIQIDGDEPPGLDGSAARFVQGLRAAGVRLQPARRAIYTTESIVTVESNGATLSFYPDERELKLSYILDYGSGSPIGWQVHSSVVTPRSFATRIGGCRTFLLEEEAIEFRRRGWGTHATVADLVVFGKKGPIETKLRFADEPARHKILDLVGDLALFGHDLRGHFVAYRSGHPLNVRMVRELAGRVSEHVPVLRQAA
jgi:UDP-3-O-acyl-N-acetylglucosamine deacetylase